ncbi:uncharacterized protein C8A04DRAFT_30413 [Dichotomopilus funicola]|uniref:Uncharacterized protein n=1 Tax=Dichotomopilus funicola TaxID=1934379 RepID=A0AAN6ZJW9_9PEZI|nr:hypothetical protein C8A04DRAFT_30413 [Dichotomopilus funicola]
MAVLLLLYGLLILGLTGIAIYEHITLSNLSLPISPALTILTVLLPILSTFTTLLTTRLLPSNRALTSTPGNTTSPNNNNHTTPSKSLTRPLGPLSRSKLLPPLLANTTLLLLLTALATLFTSPLTTGPAFTTCTLSTQWQSLYSSKNEPAIRAIQDTLNCCGFRSTRDRAWPFPRGSNPGKWEVLGVVIMARGKKRLGGFGFGSGSTSGAASGRGGGRRWGWVGEVLERVFGGGEDGWGVNGGGYEERAGGSGSRRPLLAGPEGEGGQRDEEAQRGYHEVDDDDEDGDMENGRQTSGREERGETQREGSYGAVGGGPRVEPAHLDPWAGAHRG